MTALELIRDIELACNGNTAREIEFAAMFDLGVSSAEDDHNKEITLRFKECHVQSNHPTKLSITLC